MIWMIKQVYQSQMRLLLMPRCPHFGCNKTALFKRNLRCGNCDSSRHAPRINANFSNQHSSQTNLDNINNLALMSALQSDEVHTSSPPIQHFNSCDSSDQPSAGYSSNDYSGGCSSESYSGGGGEY